MSQTATAEKKDVVGVSPFRAALTRLDRFGGTALAALVIICIVFAVLQPQFLTASNLLNVGRQSAVLIVVACGMTMVILSANIGCITHLQSGTATPVRHWIEALDERLHPAGAPPVAATPRP